MGRQERGIHPGGLGPRRRLRRGIDMKRLTLTLIAAALVAAPSPQTSQAGEAGARKLMVLGNGASPVLRGLAGSREKVDGRARVRAARAVAESRGGDRQAQRSQVESILRAELGDIDALVADLAEIDPAADDQLLVQVALEAGVALVLERVHPERMAQLTGHMGVSADLIVIRRGEQGQLRLNVWSDEGEVGGDVVTTELPPTAAGAVPGFEKVTAEVEKLLEENRLK